MKITLKEIWKRDPRGKNTLEERNEHERIDQN